MSILPSSWLLPLLLAGLLTGDPRGGGGRGGGPGGRGTGIGIESGPRSSMPDADYPVHMVYLLDVSGSMRKRDPSTDDPQKWLRGGH